MGLVETIGGIIGIMNLETLLTWGVRGLALAMALFGGLLTGSTNAQTLLNTWWHNIPLLL